MTYREDALHQIAWVRDRLAFAILNSLKPDISYEEAKDKMLVDGTHTSKSIELPVYHFELDGVVVKLRGNFHDWCVRCNKPMLKPFPEWMNVSLDDGCFEGMANEQSATKFCVGTQEKLYMSIMWLLNEGI